MKMLFTSMDRMKVAMLRNIIEEAGIEIEVRNDVTSANYPTAPFYPELWIIHDEDFVKAAELRDAWRATPPAAQSPWSCPNCGEQLEAQFNSCWQCGAVRETVATLDSVSFDCTRYSFNQEANHERTWFTPAGDVVSLAFCSQPPKLPHQTQTSMELQKLYETLVCNERVKMIEFSLPRLADTTCIWTALRMQRQPHGMTYIGSLLIPFSAFWFIIRMQCDERGITGTRETALLITAQQEGKVTITPDGKLVGDWSPDDQRYDEKFPDHPLSRLRREFATIRASLKIHNSIKNEKRFDLPAPAA